MKRSSAALLVAAWLGIVLMVAFPVWVLLDRPEWFQKIALWLSLGLIFFSVGYLAKKAEAAARRHIDE
jgi:hypothetical protein